jgi:hypothetical protein
MLIEENQGLIRGLFHFVSNFFFEILKQIFRPFHIGTQYCVILVSYFKLISDSKLGKGVESKHWK